jgi:formimidoylglutamate deiminase
LFSRALTGGSQASGQTTRGLRVGAPADLVAMYDDDPMLVGHGAASLLDALVFSGYRLPIERVMVNGEWRVVDGDHIDSADTRQAYADTLQRIGIAS